MLCAVGFAALGLLFGASSGTTYTASTRILINPLPGNPFSPDSLARRSDSLTNVQTEAQLVTSPAVLKLARPAAPDLPNSQGLRKVITLDVPPNTQVIDIGYTAASADSARQGANAMAGAFLQYRVSRATKTIAERRASIERAISSVQDALDAPSKKRAAAVDPTVRASIEQQTRSQTAQLAEFQAQLAQLESASRDPGEVIVSDERAAASGGPMGLPPIALAVAGLLGGAALGLLAAALRERSQDRVRSAGSVAELGTDVLAQVPAAVRRAGSAADPASRTSQRFRFARSALRVRLDPPTTIAVLGLPEHGRGIDLALCLGNTLARGGHRVLVVLAEDMAPSPRTGLVVDRGAVGLSEVILDELPVGRACYQVAPGLTVMPAGRELLAASEFYSSGLMPELLNRLRAGWDIVLIGAPPATTADGHVLAELSDATILGVDLGTTRHAQVRALIDLSEQAGWSLVGTVVTEPRSWSERLLRRQWRVVEEEPAGGPATTDGQSAEPKGASGAVDGHPPHRTPDVTETQTQSRDHLATLARGSALNLSGAGVGSVAGFLLVVVAARGFPAELAGTLFAATSLFLIASSVTELGVDVGVVHAIPRYRVLGRGADVTRVLWIGLVPVLVMSVLSTAAMLASAGAFANLVGDNPALMDEATTIVRVLAIFLPLAALQDIALAGTRAFGSMRATVVVDKVGRPTTQVVAAAAAAVASAGALALSLAWALPFLPAALAACWFLRKALRRDARRRTSDHVAGAHQPPTPWRELSREFWAFTLPRAAARVCQVILLRFDIILVAALRSPAQAAVYTAATRFLVLGQLGVQAVQQVIQPQLSRLIALRDSRATKEVFETATIWLVLLCWPLYLTIAVWPDVLLRLFGPNYTTGDASLTLLCLTMLFATATGPVDVALVMAGRSGLSLLNMIVSLAINVGLDLYLVPRHGIIGAAIGWAVAIVLRNLLNLWQVRRLLQITSWGPGLLWAGVSCLVCFGLLPMLTRLAGWQTFSAAVAMTVVGTGLFGLALVVGRQRLALDVLVSAIRGRVTAS